LINAHNNDVLSINFIKVNPASEKVLEKGCDPWRTDKLGGMVGKFFYGINQITFHALIIRHFLLYSLIFRLKGGSQFGRLTTSVFVLSDFGFSEGMLSIKMSSTGEVV
jgi:hypothetical protein